MGEPAWPTKRLFAVVSVLVLAVVVIVLGRSVTDRSSPASEGRPGPSVDDQTTLPADRSHSAGHVPRDDLFGTEPFHTEWLDEVMAMRLRVMNDPANRPPPCQPFGSVRWADTTPAQRARIEILTNKRTGSVGGGTWIDTGIETDEPSMTLTRRPHHKSLAQARPSILRTTWWCTSMISCSRSRFRALQ